MNIQEFAGRHLLDYKSRKEEITAKYCPYCHGGQHKDKYTFSINTAKQVYSCRRGSCGKQGKTFQLLKDFGEELDQDYNSTFMVSKTYKKPSVIIKHVSREDDLYSYFKKRGISKETVDNRKIFLDKTGNIVFPYYEKEHVVLYKYRSMKEKASPKSWQSPDSKPILWGIHECDIGIPLVIVEGEIDALSLDEAGIKNVVSVPVGCKNLEFMNLNWDILEKFSKIIIWGDNDDAGKEMVQTLVIKFKAWRCFIVECNMKDANEVLMALEPRALSGYIETAKQVVASGLIDLASVKTINDHDKEKVKTGIKRVDVSIRSLNMGDVSIWTGQNASGKSTLLGQVMLESIEQDYSVCAYSGELPAPSFKSWINLQACGEKDIEFNNNSFYGKIPYVPEYVSKQIANWYQGKFFLYDNDGGSQEENLLNVFEIAARRYNCRVFLVDNLMTTSSDGSDRDFYRNQSNFIKKLMSFAKTFNVHVHLVAHPRKQTGMISKEEISGSGDITNLADNVFSVHRITDDDKKENAEFEEVDTIVTVLKNRAHGIQNLAVKMVFRPSCKRLYEFDNQKPRRYGWQPKQLGLGRKDTE